MPTGSFLVGILLLAVFTGILYVMGFFNRTRAPHDSSETELLRAPNNSGTTSTRF